MEEWMWRSMIIRDQALITGTRLDNSWEEAVWIVSDLSLGCGDDSIMRYL